MRRWWTRPPTCLPRSTAARESLSKSDANVDLDPNSRRSHVGREADPAVGNRDARPPPRAAQELAARADVGAVADHAVADQRPRADAHPEADDRALDHAAGLDPDPVEDHGAVQPDTRTDLGAPPDDRAADQHRARRHRRAVVHQLLAA